MQKTGERVDWPARYKAYRVNGLQRKEQMCGYFLLLFARVLTFHNILNRSLDHVLHRFFHRILDVLFHFFVINVEVGIRWHDILNGRFKNWGHWVKMFGDRSEERR